VAVESSSFVQRIQQPFHSQFPFEIADAACRPPPSGGTDMIARVSGPLREVGITRETAGSQAF